MQLNSPTRDRTKTVSMRTQRIALPEAKMSLWHEGHCGCEQCRFEWLAMRVCLVLTSAALGFIWMLMEIWK